MAEPYVNILAVCRHNSRRSRITQVVIRDMAGKYGIPVRVDSAGIYPNPHGIKNETAEALQKKGYHPALQDSKPVTLPLLKSQNYLWCMERREVEEVLERFPEIEGRIRISTLPEAAGHLGGEEIGDTFMVPWLRWMPAALRELAARRLGVICSDYDDEIELGSAGLIERIERYAAAALRMLAEERGIPYRQALR